MVLTEAGNGSSSTLGRGSERKVLRGLVFLALSVKFPERGREWRQIEK